MKRTLHPQEARPVKNKNRITITSVSLTVLLATFADAAGRIKHRLQSKIPSFEKPGCDNLQSLEKFGAMTSNEWN